MVAVHPRRNPLPRIECPNRCGLRNNPTTDSKRRTYLFDVFIHPPPSACSSAARDNNKCQLIVRDAWSLRVAVSKRADSSQLAGRNISGAKSKIEASLFFWITKIMQLQTMTRDVRSKISQYQIEFSAHMC